jgi:hypothetical protein
MHKIYNWIHQEDMQTRLDINVRLRYAGHLESNRTCLPSVRCSSPSSYFTYFIHPFSTSATFCSRFTLIWSYLLLSSLSAVLSVILFPSLLYSDSSILLILPSHCALHIIPQSFIQNVSILVKFHDQISSSGANSPSAVGRINRILENTRLKIKHELLQI